MQRKRTHQSCSVRCGGEGCGSTSSPRCVCVLFVRAGLDTAPLRCKGVVGVLATMRPSGFCSVPGGGARCNGVSMRDALLAIPYGVRGVLGAVCPFSVTSAPRRARSRRSARIHGMDRAMV